ncbi:lactam utilization protein lamb [Mycena galericulata]|nr:lactam utilization protein lamb [Mycena galericulata]
MQSDDEALMKTDHLANIATVVHAKTYDVAGGARTSLPFHRGFLHRELSMEPDELCSCFVYQIGVLAGFLKLHGLPLNHVVSRVQYTADCAFLPSPSCSGYCNADIFRRESERGIRWFSRNRSLVLNSLRRVVRRSGLLRLRRTVSMDLIRKQVAHLLLETHQITTNAGGYFSLGESIGEVTICCHLDTPGTVVITTLVKALVDESNERAGYN